MHTIKKKQEINFYKLKDEYPMMDVNMTAFNIETFNYLI